MTQGRLFESRVEREFAEWISTADGRRVEDEIVRRARLLKSRGWGHYGIAALIETVRYDASVSLLGDEQGYRINNNHKEPARAPRDAAPRGPRGLLRGARPARARGVRGSPTPHEGPPVSFGGGMAELTKCTSCHKPIRMCRTEKGRLMPVDPDPVGQSVGLERTGNARLTLQDGLHGFEVRVLKDAEPWDGPLYVSHFATCPEARRWINRKDLRKAADDAIERVRDLGRR